MVLPIAISFCLTIWRRDDKVLPHHVLHEGVCEVDKSFGGTGEDRITTLPYFVLLPEFIFLDFEHIASFQKLLIAHTISTKNATSIVVKVAYLAISCQVYCGAFIIFSPFQKNKTQGPPEALSSSPHP